MITIRNLKLNKVTDLRNAYDVSYEKPVNQIWTAGFSLPLNDPTNKKINQMHYAEIVDNDGEYIGLFRVMTRTSTFSHQGRYIKYDCYHVLSTLMDSTIPGYRQTQRGWTTRAVIEWILSFQDVKHWQLGRCDFDRLYEYSFENQNGLADALFSITEVFAEDYMWTWDTSSYPWTINLIKPTTKPVCRIREGWNLQTLSVEENPLKLINHLTALGKGDGINNVNFKKINGGKNYVEDIASQNQYGKIEYILKDERFTVESALLSSAQAMLERFKRPIVTWKIKAVDLIKSIPNKSTIRIPKTDELRSGRVVQLWTTLFGVVNLRIVNEKKSDMYGDPGDIDLEIGYIGEDITTSLADIERRMEIYKLSSVGATNKDTTSFAENCDVNFPLRVRFYCEEELKRINKVLLTFQTERYRAYSRATKGGGAVVSGGTTAGGGTYVSSSSTSAGGSFVQGSSTASGGGTTVGSTSQSGGGSTQSSTAGGNHKHLVAVHGTAEIDMPSKASMFSFGAGSNPTIEDNVGVWFAGDYQDNLTIWTKGASDAHSHTVNIPSHTHGFSVTIPSHSHDFNINIPNHTHDFNISIPDHTHDFSFSLPDHIHEIDYGIWEDSDLPTRLEVTIDGTLVTTIDGLRADRLDIVSFLYKETDGQITRGWHTIEIKPIGARARFVGQCTVYGFIGATDGGEF